MTRLPATLHNAHVVLGCRMRVIAMETGHSPNGQRKQQTREKSPYSLLSTLGCSEGREKSPTENCTTKRETQERHKRRPSCVRPLSHVHLFGRAAPIIDEHTVLVVASIHECANSHPWHMSSPDLDPCEWYNGWNNVVSSKVGRAHATICS